MSGLYISLRQSDVPVMSAEIANRLAETLGGERVFYPHTLESPSPKSQAKFEDRIARHLVTASAMLVVIGPGWLTRDAQGVPRLHSRDDYVRLELATALERGIPIIPVLVAGVPGVPDGNNLPDDLRPALGAEPVRIRDNRFEIDVQAIAARVEPALKAGAANPTAGDLLKPGLGLVPVTLSSGETFGGFEALRLQSLYDQVKDQLSSQDRLSRCSVLSRAYEDALTPFVDHTRFQITPNLSPTLAKSARQACKLKPFQPIIAAIDLSLFRWGRAAIVITEAGLYHYADREPTTFVANATLARGPIECAGGHYLCIGTDVISIPARLDTARILAFVRATAKVVRNGAGLTVLTNEKV